MNYLRFLPLLVAIALLLWLAGIVRLPHTKVRYTPQCEYRLPNQYFLVQDSVTGKYAIQFMHIGVYAYYLYATEYISITPRLSDLGTKEEAWLFNDSCSAKGFAKSFFDKKLEKETAIKFNRR